MDAGFEARLQGDDVAFTVDDATLLRTVDDTGSLNRAAEDLGRSYSRAHQRLKALETEFGGLVDRQRGGSGGGGSQLTENARTLLARFDRLTTGYTSIADTREAVLPGRVVDRDGELGTVETDAGRFRALVPPTGDRVQVSIRADTVTIHDPSDVPGPSSTSARNRFSGTVVEIDHGEVVALVSVELDGTSTRLYARLTQESLDRLALESGSAVVATFKATATHATQATPEARDTAE